MSRDLCVEDVPVKDESGPLDGLLKPSLFPVPAYCVVYRTGGTKRFTWHRASAGSQEACEAMQQEVTQMGYLAYCMPFNQSLREGLPTSYDWKPNVGGDNEA